MDLSDRYEFGSSLRAQSSRIWRSSGIEVFTRDSAREENDEEALRWAALEKLPTFNRLKKGLWTGSHGEACEIDIDELGFQDRKNLIERLIKVAEEDNEKFLLKLKARLDRYEKFLFLLSFDFVELILCLMKHFCCTRVGIENPTIEVRFDHLNVEAETYVGSRALPSFINFVADIVEV